MKALLNKVLSFFLVGVMLSASTGVVIASHICYASQKSDVSLFEREGCCSPGKDACEDSPSQTAHHIQKNCCELTISYHKLDVTSLQKTEIPVFDLFTFFSETHYPGCHFSQSLSSVEKIPDPGTNYPSQDFLISNGILRI